MKVETDGLAVRVWDREGAQRLAGGARCEVLAGAELESFVQRAVGGERFHIRRDHDGKTYEITFGPLADPLGAASGAFCVSTDVTDRLQAVAQLHERLRFEKLVAELSTHFIQISPERIDAGVNDALARLGEFASVDRTYIFRFSRDGTAVSNTHEWCAEGISREIDHLQDLPVEAFPWSMIRIRRREVLHVPRVADLPPEAAAERDILERQGIKSLVIVPLADDHATLGWMGFDSVRQEKTWHDTDVALLRLVGEMFVNALARKKSGELAAELVEARSLENVARLAGGIAHDFNNLVAVILNYASVLRRELRDPPYAEPLEAVYESARRAAELTRQLLQVGRRGMTKPVVLDLNTVVAGLESLLRVTVGERVELVTRLSEDIPLVRIGLPQLEQVLLNLAVNAREAMGEGGKLVIATEKATLDDVSAGRSVDLSPGTHAVLTVTDTGCGMAPEVARRAFDPFFTTKGARGTGLGLATTLGIVKQASGHVQLDTTEGRGTTVRVYLPGVPAPATGPGDAKPEATEAAERGAGETVLLVEDAAPLRRLVRTVLTDHGYHVVDAASAEEAIERCAQEGGRIDLLLTDVILPGMSGRALAEALLQRYRVDRCVYMTGYDADIVARQGIVPEERFLLQKPFLEPDLLRIVSRALRRA